jgi:demethylmenaquinone methyltransferase/2-methoxy-6-polyprenyl-1,4-benzoquinol methylase
MNSILLALDRHASERPRDTAIIDVDGTEHSWTRLRERVAQVRSFVDASSALDARIGVSLLSGSDFWIALLGVAAAGRVPCLLPCPIPGLLAERVAPELRCAFTLDAITIKDAAHTPISAASARASRGVILLSSGTTGHSRFVLRSSDGIDAIASTLIEEELAVANDIVASFLPMTHAYGFEHAFLAPILAGSCVRVLGAFSLDRAADALAKGATSFPLVPITADALVEIALPNSTLRSVVVAGSALNPLVRERFERAFRMKLIDLYGATELGTIWIDRGQGGRLVRGVELTLLDGERTASTSLNTSSTRGEIAVRSAGMLVGIIEADGTCTPHSTQDFFRTGDIGERTADGEFRITGRLRLVFDVGGLKVNPLEVERALETHPAIRRALVKPIAIDSTLQRVGADIELHDSVTAPSLGELRMFLAALLPPHALPRCTTVVRELPVSSSGKLLRNTEPTVWKPVVSRPAHLADRTEREDYTRSLFDRTARGYDNASGVAFLRSGRWYRRRMLLQGGLTTGCAHLDVGSGTGLCAAIAQVIVGPQGRVVALDPSSEMLKMATKRGVRETVVARAENLPFPNATFDFVSMSYMLRHIDDLSLGFAEARRVLRPGGRLMIFEVTQPESTAPRYAFDVAMSWIVPSIGIIASGRVSTFSMMRYWADTIRAASRPERILEALDHSGFTGTRHTRELGVFSYYRGSAPLV